MEQVHSVQFEKSLHRLLNPLSEKVFAHAAKLTIGILELYTTAG
jgi:hypothetical protein